MSLPADQVLIFADDHLDIHAMPPDTWSSRLPKDWRGDSTWPHSRTGRAESPLAHHAPGALRRVTCENAARVYGFRM